jgi:hypothetical protein
LDFFTPFFTIRQRLGVRGLEFEQMRRLGRLRQAQANTVKTAGKMPASGLVAPLVAILILVPHFDTYRAQIRDQARFLVVAAVKQAQHPAVKVCRFCPAE